MARCIDDVEFVLLGVGRFLTLNQRKIPETGCGGTGDTGSLALGGIIATFAIAIRKELLIPILCGIFFVESLSVILQVYYFKYQKRKRGIEYARENRLFKMSPLHHHYQKLGFIRLSVDADSEKWELDLSCYSSSDIPITFK